MGVTALSYVRDEKVKISELCFMPVITCSFSSLRCSEINLHSILREFIGQYFIKLEVLAKRVNDVVPSSFMGCRDHSNRL